MFKVSVVLAAKYVVCHAVKSVDLRSSLALVRPCMASTAHLNTCTRLSCTFHSYMIVLADLTVTIMTVCYVGEIAKPKIVQYSVESRAEERATP